MLAQYQGDDAQQFGNDLLSNDNYHRDGQIARLGYLFIKRY